MIAPRWGNTPAKQASHKRKLVLGLEKRKRKDAIRAVEAEREREADQLRTHLPNAPCFRCGSRGWCGHDGRSQ